MTAQPSSSPPAPERRTGERATDASSHVVDLLYRRLRPVLVGWCEQFVEQAPAMLLAKADAATSHRERRELMDAARTLRRIQSRAYVILKAALLAGIRGVEPAAEAHAVDVPETGELSLKDDDSLEEMLAVSRMVQRLETEHATALWELERRLRQARESGVRLSVDALLPSGIAEAWRRTLSDVDVWPREKQLLFAVFADFLAPRLGELIEAATQALEACGFHGELPVPRRAVRSAADDRDIGPAADAVARALAALSPGDGDEAGRLRRSLDGLIELLMRADREQAHALGASVVAASSVVDRLARDLRVPAPVRHRFDALRAPVAVAAALDPKFLRDPEHPLRRTLGELHELAVSTALAGGDIEAVAELVDAHARQWQARLANTAAAMPAEPPSEADLARFTASEAEQAAQRNRRLVEQVKAQVREEIRSRIGELQVPDGAREFLLHGFGPLMGMLLARHGPQSEAWRAAQRRLDRLADQLRLHPLEPADEQERKRLLEAVEVDLLAAGMAPERVRALLDGLREAWAHLDARRRREGRARWRRALAVLAADPERSRGLREQIGAIVAEELRARFDAQRADTAIAAVLGQSPQVAPERRRLLAAILLKGAWLRRVDGDRTTGWLRVAALDLDTGEVALHGIDGQPAGVTDIDALLDQLRRGTLEPLRSDARDADRWQLLLSDR